MATARIIAGLGFAVVLLLLGVWVWDGTVVLWDAAATVQWRVARLGLGLGLACGAQVVFMCLVGDAVCPDAPMVVTGVLKTLAAVGAWGGLLAAGAALVLR